MRMRVSLNRSADFDVAIGQRRVSPSWSKSSRCLWTFQVAAGRWLLCGSSCVRCVVYVGVPSANVARLFAVCFAIHFLTLFRCDSFGRCLLSSLLSLPWLTLLCGALKLQCQCPAPGPVSVSVPVLAPVTYVAASALRLALIT